MLINLKKGNYTAVADTYGGELISFKDKNGTEYVWGGDENSWTGRSPHLFPMVGTLKGDKALMEGNYYNMKKHGLIRISELEVQEVTEASVTFVLRASENTLQFYPYKFAFYVKHTLDEKGFTTTYTVVNEDNKIMNFNIGGHAGVRCPIGSEGTFDQYEIVFDCNLTTKAYFPPSDDPITEEDGKLILENTNTLPLNYEYFSKGAMIIDQIESHSLQLRQKESQKGIEFQYEGFPVLALWTMSKKNAPYICLEPWHGLPAMSGDTENFNEKPYSIALTPKESKSLQYHLQIL